MCNKYVISVYKCFISVLLSAIGVLLVHYNCVLSVIRRYKCL